MTLTHSMTDEAAELLYAAQEGRAPIEPLSQRFPGLNVADALPFSRSTSAADWVRDAPWSDTRSA